MIDRPELRPLSHYDDGNMQNSKSRLTKVSSSVSETLFTSFDASGNVLGSQQHFINGQTYGLSYTYNLNNDLLTQTYPSNKVVRYEYDETGDLSRVKRNFSVNYAQSLKYTASGEIEQLRFGNNRWETTQFNSRRQVKEIGVGYSAGDTGIWKANYEYGTWQDTTLNPQKNNGSLARQTILVPTLNNVNGFTAIQTYAYDPLDRLKSATETTNGSQTWKQTFNYDRFGNKNYDNSNTTTLGSCVVAVCNPTPLGNNHLSGYGYDNAGNITSDAEGRTFTYDAENRQVSASGSNLSMSYAYDGNGKRVKTHDSINNQTTYFIYDAEGKLATEYTVNVPPPEFPTISYLTNDALGSPRVITNAYGELKARRDFFPFGEEISIGVGSRSTDQKYFSDSDDTRVKFATYQRDAETKLDFALSRYYSPMHGRFTSPDEFKGGPDELFDFADDASGNPTVNLPFLAPV
ncbi:MAG: RHS repeat domain-containing protein [Pyrinomonadaceae bacterium]